MTTEATSPAQVVGENARRLRTERGLTLEQVARECQQFGLRWTTSKVGDFEGGRVSPTLPTLYAFALALSSLGAEEVSLFELFAGSGAVRLNPNLTVPREALARALRGDPIDPANELLRDPATLAVWQRKNVEYSQFLAGVQPLLRRYAKLLPSNFIDDFMHAISTTGLADDRAAHDLGVKPNELLFYAMRLWGSSFSGERDRRAGADANAQKRGQISRTMKDELQEAISRGND